MTEQAHLSGIDPADFKEDRPTDAPGLGQEVGPGFFQTDFPGMPGGQLPHPPESVRVNMLRHLAEIKATLPDAPTQPSSLTPDTDWLRAKTVSHATDMLPSVVEAEATFSDLASKTANLVQSGPHDKTDRAAAKDLSRMPGGQAVIKAFFGRETDLDKVRQPYTLWRLHLLHEFLGRIDEMYQQPGVGVRWLTDTRDRDGQDEQGNRTVPRHLADTVPNTKSAARLRNRLLFGFRRSILRGTLIPGDSEADQAVAAS